MPDSPSYTPIQNNEVDADSPLTASLAFRWAFNPISIMQGSPTARAAGMGVWIEKSPGGGDPAQTGILTDATDTSLRLAPDGAGSVAWSAAIYTDCKFLILFHSDPESGPPPITNDLYDARNVTMQDVTGSPGYSVVNGKSIKIQKNSRIVTNFVATMIGNARDVTFRICRKRSGSISVLSSVSFAWLSEWTDSLSIPIITDNQENDEYFAEYAYNTGYGFAGIVTFSSSNLYSIN